MTNPTNTVQTATYTVTPTSGSCAGSTFTVTVTVNPRPAVTNMTSNACSGDAFTVTPTNGANGVVPAGTTYSWSAPVVTGSMTGGVAGSGANITGTLTNPTNTAQTATYTVTPTSGSCAGSNFTVTVTVNPKPAVTNMTSTICSGDSFTATPANGTNGIVPAGTTYTWTAPSVTGGITGGAAGSGASITGTLTNPTNTVQTATYTVTPTSGSCAGSTFTVTVTVNPRPAVTNMTSNACSGDAFTVTPTNGANGVVPAGTTYSWSAPVVTGSMTGGVAGSGTSITGTLTNPTNTAQTATYTVTPTSGSCAGSNFTVTVTVNPKPAVTNMTSTICSGDSFTATPANGTNGIVPAGTTYTWTAPSVTGGITGGAAGSGASITGTLTNPTNTVQTATYTVTPTSGSCAGSTFIVTVTVNPKPNINNLNTTTCTGGAFSVSPINGTDGIVPSGITYSWSAPVVTGGVTGGAAGSGSIISGTLTNPTNVSQTATYTVTPSTAQCTGTPFTVVVTVFPITSIISQPSNSGGSVCFGDGFSPISVSAVGGNLTYQWYRNPIPSNSGGIAIPGATSASFTPPSTPQGSMYYYVVVTGACGTETSNASGLYFVAPPITTITSHPSTTPQAVCLNGSFSSISINATGAGTLTYQWYSNTTNSNSGGTLIPGATNSTFTPPATTSGTTYYYATAKSDCGTVPSNVSGAFTVYQPPTVTNPTTASTCSGAGPNISLTASVASNFTWTIGAITGGITGASAGSGATINQTLTNPSNSTAGTVEYIVTPTSITGSCPGAPYTITVTVNPRPVVTNPATVTTCSGTGPNISLTASVPSSFTWTIGTITGGITGASGGSGATINQTLTNPSNATAGTVQYIVTPTSTTGSCTGAPYTITVTVNPTPTVTNSTLTQTICSGGSTTAFTPTSGVAGTTFNWTASATSGVSGFTPSGTGPIPAQTISTTGTTQGTVTYVITPTANGCPGPSTNYTILVNPRPTVTNTTLSQTICSGGSTTLVNLTSGVSGTTFTWTASATAGVTGFASSGSGSIPVQTISTTGTTQGAVTYVITPTANGCTGPTATYTVLVNPLATVGPTSNPWPSVCRDSNPVLTPFTQPTTGVTGIGVPTGLPAGVTAVFNSSTGNIEFSGNVSGAPTGLYNYSIPLTGNCINGLTATGTIDVTPVYDITAISSVSATTIGGSATVFFYGDPTSLLNGTYQVSYQIRQANGAWTTSNATATVSNGRGTFSIPGIMSNTDTYTVQMLSIKKTTDVCTILLDSNPPTTYFGVCSAVFGGNGTFVVPANIYSITIEVYGGGGAGDNGGGGGGGYSIRQNIPVTPGEPLGIFIGAGGASRGANGGNSYVTRDSSLPNQAVNSMVFAYGGNGSQSSGNAAGGAFDPRYSGSNGSNASGNNGGKAGGPVGGNGGASGENGINPGGGGGRWSGTRGRGGNGLVVISYSCPDADKTDCINVIDDGAKSGTTVLEFTCDYNWVAPEGLSQFTVYVGGAGGGGGSGEGSGGGGSGALIRQSFTTTSPYGLPANSSYSITVGQGGLGAQSPNNNGFPGGTTTFSGPSTSAAGATANISVAGGGGGGSRAVNTGGSGSSGGGGSATPSPTKSSGLGGSAISVSYTGTNVTIYQGNVGGNGDYSEPQNSVAGGGGGGLVPWGNGNDGQHGKAAGNGQGEGGRGGDGIVLTLGDSTRRFGAGGGGIGRYFNGTDKIGLGGSAGGVRIGGSGNLTGVNPVGTPGTNKTGSGGGAGYYQGGRGGNGIVYVTFVNVRILEVEFQEFRATFNSTQRSGDLTWTTAKEWDNSHFEIERSVNGIKDWVKVGQVAGSGYSDAPRTYNFSDTNLPAAGGNIFYRLKQVDHSGKFSYSVTRAIQVEPVKGSTAWVIYPNPTDGSEFHIELLSSEEILLGEVNAMITTSNGQTQFFSDSDIERLSRAIGTYLQPKAAGVYVLSLSWNGKTESFRIIKK
ncbi:MAG: T9SS type A sorting domain-containing protein [Cyclobacteriaceae bacterium]|nr:T9SS type A sorting domain-containing protein [Cyclobacteriaceae bacterium]